MFEFCVLIITGMVGILAACQSWKRNKKNEIPLTVMITILVFWFAFAGITVDEKVYYPEKLKIIVTDNSVIVMGKDFSESFGTISAMRKLTTDRDDYVVKVTEGRNILKGLVFDRVDIIKKEK